ncbi:hypothetical protein, conserved [Trypanosoma brucei brucei TREU927]|uniref:PARP-type domain-containing protein n=1 Tax=Trypanosoma brucei brucei (strain 927/4 GUTat10.1) TaxID=185431 RepID=Q38AV1_TRYB2|nr:hypothetical protein, conserved [Trypanosoma brucei brucei TREU927]EAN78069.1 hypothetical protein, conserved [Trypanosoma brucei brucei TREU927]
MPQLRVEYAKSGRAKCSAASCNKPISKHEVRVGIAVMFQPVGSTSGEPTLSYKWRHVCCFTERQIKNAEAEGGLDAIEGLEELAEVDRDLIAQMMRGELIDRMDVMGRVGDVENSPASRGSLKGEKFSHSDGRAATKRKRGDGSESRETGSPPDLSKRGKSKKGGVVSLTPSRDKDTNEGEISDSTTEEFEVSVEATRPPCPYGKECFRTSVSHMAEYSHGAESDRAVPARLRAVIRHSV